MEEIHKISDANTGSVLKQGDTTELKFKLYDANDDNIDHILNKPAEVVFLANGEVYYRTEGHVDDLYICTFTIDEVLPKGMYHIEFIVEGGIYPSGDKPYFTITRSSRGKDLNTIQAYGFEDLVIRTTEEVSTRLENTVTEIEEAELDRQAQEEARKTAEAQREANEAEREANEQTRINKDRSRDDKIAQMEEAEVDRQEAELDRQAQEEARKTAEAQREANEAEREANEQTRINKDRSRDDKIAQMEEAEVDRQEAELDRQAQEEAREETHEKVKDLPEAFQSVIDETTGKDVISAPEIIAARRGKASLGEKIDEVTTQLARKAAKDEARLKSQKLELEDLSPSALSAIEGGKGTEFNLLTIPQPNSVTPLTLSKDVSGLNNYSTISTYMNGKLTKIEEKDGLVSKKITILAYGADGKLNSVKESRQGGGTETHLSYEGGGVSTSKTSWVAKTYVLKGSEVSLLETAGTETDYASFRMPEDAVAGTQGVDYVARLYKKDGTEIREIPYTQRTTAEGIGGFYWSTTRVSLVFEKDKYASLEEAKAALAGLVLQYKIK